jgi:hypothetical protein
VPNYDSRSNQRRERDWRCQGYLFQESRDGSMGMMHLCVLPRYHFPPCMCWCENPFTPEDPQPVQTEFIDLLFGPDGGAA